MLIDLFEFEGLYKINGNGEIFSVPRKGTKGGLIKQYLDDDGYFKVSLCKDSKKITRQVNRLVFYSFYPDTNSDLQINHKDENTKNNNINNLEAISQIENLNYGTRNKRISKTNTNRKDCSKEIICYTYSSNDYVGIFKSTKEVERQLGVNHSHVSKCCKGTLKQCNGYRFEYNN